MSTNVFSVLLWAPGIGEIAVIAIVVLVLFGGGKIAGLGKGLGEGIRNFKQGLKGDDPPPADALKKTDNSDAKH